MTLTFPRDMITGRKWRQTRLALAQRQELSRTADGRTTARDLGIALWRGVQFMTVPMPRDNADLVMADFQSLRGAINSFYLYDVARQLPVAMSSEGQFDLSSVTVSSVSGSRDALALTGLPVGFVMTSGDYLSVQTAIGGRELFRVVNARQGEYDGLGTTPLMEVEPHVRVSVAPGDVVDLVRPLVEMRLEPQTLDDPMIGILHKAITFSAVQVIR